MDKGYLKSGKVLLLVTFLCRDVTEESMIDVGIHISIVEVHEPRKGHNWPAKKSYLVGGSICEVNTTSALRNIF